MKYGHKTAYAVNHLNNENELMDDSYCDLCSIYDFHDNPPPALFDEWQAKAYDPFCQTIVRKIGNTWYVVNTECGGTEPLGNKVKRLIFTDPMSKKAV